MRKITIMVSSVIESLKAERDAIKEAFKDIEFVELIGASPFNSTATAASSATATVKMAKECDVYFLILSEKYGMKTLEGKSATEVEFDAAVKADPTKVMVFKKKSDKRIDKEQKEFIKKVSDYNSGYFRPEFEYSHELKDMALNTFFEWLAERAQLNSKLNYIDHFVRIAKQILPSDDAKIFYKTTESDVELKYKYAGQIFSVHFDNRIIHSDFWGCVNELQRVCNTWRDC